MWSSLRLSMYNTQSHAVWCFSALTHPFQLRKCCELVDYFMNHLHSSRENTIFAWLQCQGWERSVRLRIMLRDIILWRIYGLRTGQGNPNLNHFRQIWVTERIGLSVHCSDLSLRFSACYRNKYFCYSMSCSLDPKKRMDFIQACTATEHRIKHSIDPINIALSYTLIILVDTNMMVRTDMCVLYVLVLLIAWKHRAEAHYFLFSHLLCYQALGLHFPSPRV